MIRHIIIFFAFSASLFAVDTNIAKELSNNAVDTYNLLISLGRGMRWIFALLPVAVSFLSISKDISEIRKSKEMMQQDTGLKGEDIFVIAYHIVLVFISCYIIYGIFGLTYANASSMNEVWSVLVVDFWRGIL